MKLFLSSVGTYIKMLSANQKAALHYRRGSFTAMFALDPARIDPGAGRLANRFYVPILGVKKRRECWLKLGQRGKKASSVLREVLARNT